MLGELARWSDSKEDASFGVDDWYLAVDNVLTQMDGNADKLIRLSREASYYPSIDPPIFNQQGGLVDNNFSLTMSADSQDEGVIYYTINGADPRLSGTGEINPNSIEYIGDISITTTTHVKARLLSKNIWSALNETTFNLVKQKPQLTITEIMYNPLTHDDYEFIELQNTGNGDLDLQGMFFEGINYILSSQHPFVEAWSVCGFSKKPS